MQVFRVQKRVLHQVGNPQYKISSFKARLDIWETVGVITDCENNTVSCVAACKRCYNVAAKLAHCPRGNIQKTAEAKQLQ